MKIKNYFDYVVSLLEFNDTTSIEYIERQKELERKNALKSALRQNIFNGIEVRISTHAASQAKVRRSDLENFDWNLILDRITKKIKDHNLTASDYLFYSKSYEEGIIVSWDETRLVIVTILPKGRYNTKPGTTISIVEDLSGPCDKWVVFFEEIA